MTDSKIRIAERKRPRQAKQKLLSATIYLLRSLFVEQKSSLLIFDSKMRKAERILIRTPKYKKIYEVGKVAASATILMANNLIRYIRFLAIIQWNKVRRTSALRK